MEPYNQRRRCCHPLKKSARVLHIVLTAYPVWRVLCLADALVYTNSVTTSTCCELYFCPDCFENVVSFDVFKKFTYRLLKKEYLIAVFQFSVLSINFWTFWWKPQSTWLCLWLAIAKLRCIKLFFSLEHPVVCWLLNKWQPYVWESWRKVVVMIFIWFSSWLKLFVLLAVLSLMLPLADQKSTANVKCQIRDNVEH